MVAEQNQNRIQRIKYAPPPSDLPILGKVETSECSFIGETNYVAALEEKKYVFGIKRADRKRHLYVIGKSGVGKSKILELMIRQDIIGGFGVCLVDPHGEIIQNILDFIPKNRVDDVVVIDPSDTEFPVSFNPLANVNPHFRHQLAQSLLEIMEKQFGTNWTPRLEHLFRFTVLALLDYPEATMQGMIAMLTDQNYRDNVIQYIQDDMVQRFWAHEFEDWSQKFDTDAIIPLVNKLSQFLSNPILRTIFEQKENKIDLDAFIKQKKIVLVNLSKGQLGEENSSFFGLVFITKMKQAGMARAALPEKERDDFYLYIDEFQNLVTETFENMLSEARKYGIALTLAHQYIAQLSERVQQSVLGNVGSIIIFRIGGDDSVKLAPEMAPTFEPKDMIKLGVREFYMKMSIDGDAYEPFSARTLEVLPPSYSSQEKIIIEQSRKKYTATG